MRHLPEKLSLGLMLTLLIWLASVDLHTTYAYPLQPTDPCDAYAYQSGSLSGVQTFYSPYSYCSSPSYNAFVDTYLDNCGNANRDAEADTWQTRQTNSQGTRYNETGRSGWVTYPDDCNIYYVQQSYLTSTYQLADPSYGCTWFAINDNVYDALDYQCGLFPSIL
jgi:hypothetical protein